MTPTSSSLSPSSKNTRKVNTMMNNTNVLHASNMTVSDAIRVAKRLHATDRLTCGPNGTVRLNGVETQDPTLRQAAPLVDALKIVTGDEMRVLAIRRMQVSATKEGQEPRLWIIAQNRDGFVKAYSQGEYRLVDGLSFGWIKDGHVYAGTVTREGRVAINKGDEYNVKTTQDVMRVAGRGAPPFVLDAACSVVRQAQAVGAAERRETAADSAAQKQVDALFASGSMTLGFGA